MTNSRKLGRHIRNARKQSRLKASEKLAKLEKERSQQKMELKKGFEVYSKRRKDRELGSEGSTGWEALPSDLLSIVMNHLDSFTLQKTRLVCKRWNFWATRAVKELFVTEPKVQIITEEFLAATSLDLSHCPRLRNRHNVHLSKSKLPIQQLTYGQILPAYENNAFKQQITNEGLIALLSLKSLEKLVLRHVVGVTNQGLEKLSALTSLKSLEISQCTRATAAGFSFLPHLVNLQHLTVFSCLKVKESIIDQVVGATSLKSLSLSHCDITDRVRSLSSLQSLTCLELSNTDLSPLAMLALRTTVNLRALGLERCTGIMSGDVTAALRTVGDCARLNLRHTEMGAFCIPTLPLRCTALQDLKFDCGSVTNIQFFEVLTSLTALTALEVGRTTDMHDSVFDYLSKLTTLKVAKFPGTHCPQNLLEAVMELPRLEVLSVSRLGLVVLPSASPQNLQNPKPLQEWKRLACLAIKECVQLRVLDLSSTTVDFEKARDLIGKSVERDAKSAPGQKPKLEEINLFGCLISVEEIQKLNQMYPYVHTYKRNALLPDGGTVV